LRRMPLVFLVIHICFFSQKSEVSTVTTIGKSRFFSFFNKIFLFL
jgi:hypothetical protein